VHLNSLQEILPLILILGDYLDVVRDQGHSSFGAVISYQQICHKRLQFLIASIATPGGGRVFWKSVLIMTSRYPRERAEVDRKKRRAADTTLFRFHVSRVYNRLPNRNNVSKSFRIFRIVCKSNKEVNSEQGAFSQAVSEIPRELNMAQDAGEMREARVIFCKAVQEVGRLCRTGFPCEISSFLKQTTNARPIAASVCGVSFFEARASGTSSGQRYQVCLERAAKAARPTSESRSLYFPISFQRARSLAGASAARVHIIQLGT
jgi:hypothetical protein